MSEKRMVTISELLDVYKTLQDNHKARVNELEEQVEVLKSYVKLLMRDRFYEDDYYDLVELKPLINKELFK